MDPARKRTIRLVVALSAAVLLAGALVYTSFSRLQRGPHAEPAAELRAAGQDVPAHRQGRRGLHRTRAPSRTSGCATATATSSVPVRYEGVLPDPFRAGREVIVDVRKQGGVFVGEKDSLVTEVPVEVLGRPPDADLTCWSRARPA